MQTTPALLINQRAKTITKIHVECPKCQYEMNVSWYIDLVTSQRRLEKGDKPEFEHTCKGCDTSYLFHCQSALDMEMKEIPTKEFRGLMLVKRPDEELYMVVEQMFYVRDGKVDLDQQYYIDEHTCPTNWFKVLMVALNGDPDPHGVFEWVRSLTYVEIEQKFGYKRDFLRGEDDSPNDVEEALMRIFPEIETGGIIIESDAERTAAQQLMIEKGEL